MKKLVKLLLCMTLVLALTGCGKEQTATYEYVQSADGVTMTDTQTIVAKGDKCLSLKEVATFVFDGMTDEQLTLVEETYNATYSSIAATLPEGTEITYGLDGNTYNMELFINYEEADLDKLIEAGIVQAPEGQDAAKIVYISFKQTCTALESMGYTVVE